jgi:hypothetical protein
VSRAPVIAALLTVSLLAACGSDDKDKSDAKATAATTATSASASTPAATTGAAPKVTVEEARANCHALADPLISALHAVDDAAGLSREYAGYRTAVRDARLTFRKFDFGLVAKAGNCSNTVVAPATQALNHFVTADQLWSTCAQAKGCGKGAAASKLSTEWRTARDFLVNAESDIDLIRIDRA